MAKNKAIDALKRAEVRHTGPSLDATRTDHEGNWMPVITPEAISVSAEFEYLESQRLVGITEAIQNSLTRIERIVFFGVRVDRRSGAAVGRELNPPLTGQRVGQILARATVKIHAYIQLHELVDAQELGR
ncbi:MAG: hypothetical protein ACT4OM_12105 [Actinomycetota bacterium]